jgi:hypothetical protein
MKLFDTLMSKIFGHGSKPAPTASAPAGTAAPPSQSAPPASGGSMPTMRSGPATAGTAPATSGTAAPAASRPAAPATVDVDAVLTQMASKSSEKLDWKKSIVDLMKLVGMDSSLQSRKELATELGYTGDKNDSATMNVWLHKQVVKKLAENGGKVPQNLLD